MEGVGGGGRAGGRDSVCETGANAHTFRILQFNRSFDRWRKPLDDYKAQRLCGLMVASFSREMASHRI